MESSFSVQVSVALTMAYLPTASFLIHFPSLQ